MRSATRAGVTAYAMVVSGMLAVTALWLLLSCIFPMGPDAYDGVPSQRAQALEEGVGSAAWAAGFALLAAVALPVAVLARGSVGFIAGLVGTLAAVVTAMVAYDSARAGNYLYAVTAAAAVVFIVPTVRLARSFDADRQATTP